MQNAFMTNRHNVLLNETLPADALGGISSETGAITGRLGGEKKTKRKKEVLKTQKRKPIRVSRKSVREEM